MAHGAAKTEVMAHRAAVRATYSDVIIAHRAAVRDD
jgi:hypothetical protein